MFGLSFWELALILLVALLVLGPQKLPGFLKTVGKGLRELRRASSDLKTAIAEPLDEVRRPLQDLRDNLTDAVYGMETEIEREASEQDGEGDPKDAGPGAAAEKKDVEDRTREVEAVYAAAASEEARTGRPAEEAPASDEGEVSPAKRPASE